MGKFIDLTGQTFNRLTVIERAGCHGGKAMWLCRCTCGTLKIVAGRELRSGNTTSCGCYRRESSASRRSHNLEGKRFGRLTVECFDHKSPRGDYIWKCVCDCNNIVYAPSYVLVSGHTKSCGCLQKDVVALRSAYDLTGKRFARLLVEKRVGSDETGQALWQCVCDCKNHTIQTSAALVNGRTKSCGCMKSYGEQIIQQWLESHNIVYDKEHRFNDCRNKEPLPFDFFVQGENGGCIEYDGEQHFKESRLFTENVSLEERKKIDQIKDEYCKRNGIRLLRIPYWEKDNIESILSDWLFLNDGEEANSSAVDLSA